MRAHYVLVLALLTACGGDPVRAPVEDRYGTRVGHDAMVPATYKVKRGDTLFAIAWRYGFDFKGLARANEIDAPYTIFPGQVIDLRETAPAPQRITAPQRVTKSASVPKTAPSSGKSSASETVKATTNARPKAAESVPGKPVGTWRWPTEGKIVRGFSGTVHKGVDIDGKAGDAVRSVAAGKVVYAGSGIVGYGKLLIVKHNDTYLSAYGHNRSLHVQEGESVAAGQRIAEKGSSATNTVKLHFELRREGKPVDPVRLLPAR
jgi:lipoprotein NlpD